MSSGSMRMICESGMPGRLTVRYIESTLARCRLLNQKRDVQTRTAQLLVCSPRAPGERTVAASSAGSWRNLESFIASRELASQTVSPTGKCSTVREKSSQQQEKTKQQKEKEKKNKKRKKKKKNKVSSSPRSKSRPAVREFRARRRTPLRNLGFVTKGRLAMSSLFEGSVCDVCL